MIKISFDTPKVLECKRATIEIEMDKLIEHPMGTALFRGAIEELKERILFIVMKQLEEKGKSKITILK